MNSERCSPWCLAACQMRMWFWNSAKSMNPFTKSDQLEVACGWVVAKPEWASRVLAQYVLLMYNDVLFSMCCTKKKEKKESNRRQTDRQAVLIRNKISQWGASLTIRLYETFIWRTALTFCSQHCLPEIMLRLRLVMIAYQCKVKIVKDNGNSACLFSPAVRLR